MISSSPQEHSLDWKNAKTILDQSGADAVCEWLKEQTRVLITDTTMRDAHQSLLATRVRSYDLLQATEEASQVLKDAFSFEVWGGATFDVCYRFLHEDPWERLRLLRKTIPNVLLQMLIRGTNGVGYKSYPDVVIKRFIHLAAKNGIDVFRIFDCFNDVPSMQLSIDAVRDSGKIAEVCICFTGNFLSEKETIYTLEYYKDLASQIDKSGAHIIGIKDMAGLMKPQMAVPFVENIRKVSSLPLHFHCHNTSSASLTTVINMANAGCHVVDLAIASMADTTSQPSLNSFLSSMEGSARDPKIDYLTLENLDLYWSQVRTNYQPFESGLKCGTARVYDHEIPGGQYSNLVSQCGSLNLSTRWNDVLDMYKNVNQLFGNIVKVTPSSKCVGDMALYLVTQNLTCEDVLKGDKELDFPDSVIDLFSGRIGTPHHGFPEALKQIILKGGSNEVEKIDQHVNFEEVQKELEEKHKGSLSEEEVISSLLYPKVFDDFMSWKREFGWQVFFLPSDVFFSGMDINQSITIHVPPSENGQNLDLSTLEKSEVQLTRIGPLSPENTRTVEFLVNGDKRRVKIKDSTVMKLSTGPKADPQDDSHIPSPLPGAVDVIFVGKGEEVKKGDPIMTVTAMKMEVKVEAPFNGKIEKLTVKSGDRVDFGSLLAIVVASPSLTHSME